MIRYWWHRLLQRLVLRDDFGRLTDQQLAIQWPGRHRMDYWSRRDLTLEVRRRARECRRLAKEFHQ